MNRNEVDGLLLIDKPEGPTSHDVVASVRRSFRGARCGHAGTLDPFATGLLLVAVGRATRLLRFLAVSDKSYEGLVRLGFATDTDDRTGHPLGEIRSADFTPDELDRALSSLQGEHDQIPPDFSARKHRGVPHYRLARRGQEVPKRCVRVRVEWHECSRVAPDLLRVRLAVSAGTYVRALARDLGAALGCQGHLAELRRVRSGPFEVESAIPLDSSPEELRSAMFPLESIPLGLPTMILQEEGARRVRTGAGVILADLEGLEAGGWVRLMGPEGRLLGLGEVVLSETTIPGAPLVQPRVVL